jgi:hypothetical protein
LSARLWAPVANAAEEEEEEEEEEDDDDKSTMRARWSCRRAVSRMESSMQYRARSNQNTGLP